MRFSLTRLTNTALLGMVLVLTLSGVYGLFWTLNGWIWDIHRFSGWLLITALPWKSWIVVRSLRHRYKARKSLGPLVWAALFLTLVTLVVVGLGLLWNWRLGPADYPLRQTAIAWHWMLALGLLLPFGVHVLSRWARPKKVDFISRRALLRWGGLSAAALITWQAAEQISKLQRQGSAGVRASGSRQADSYSGNQYPVTHTQAARLEQIQPDVWQFILDGAVAHPRIYRYPDLLTLTRSSPAALDAALDCTLGWYSVQSWSGIPLAALLRIAGASPQTAAVRLTSVTGYSKILPIAEVSSVLLATNVGGQALAYEHGSPLRAVVPTRRGWFWVKWLTRVEALSILPPGEPD